LLSAVVVLALGACGAAPVAQPPASTAAATTAPTAAPTAASTAPAEAGITDSLGRRVSFSAAPRRIVSLAPSVTEILFAVGAGPQVVGTTQFCNFPPEADALPEVGGFAANTINVEALVDLTPDLVITAATSHRAVVEALEKLDIPVLVLVPESFEAVYTNIEQIGALTGHAQEAAALTAEMRERVAAVSARVASVPAEQRPGVFWEVTDEPLISAGPRTFIGQMIALAGATNIFADAQEDYPQVSAEAVVERDPAVILGPDSRGPTLTPDLLAQRPGWAGITAVREGRVYQLNGDIVSRPGPRLADALEELAQALYPKLFL
jgi:iron complex transport system substrate-binding protein